MSQKQDTSIAAEVMGTSSSREDTSFFYQDLEHGIPNTLSELEEKSAQVVTLEKEIWALKASLVPILGLNFMHRVQQNPVWAAVDSQEFDAHFMHHEVLAVANMATLV
eukprot:CAMPEP_0170113244 /NCGR_PEP_ID=MMETSP0020_2-20130122/9748_1 /TAXON_ID=98059 /ORGANISM="Dinobryon sp., Strain UTEXLB2267" /LENGTH=107 /DNA_ID=CAMNT_0010339513 /DNA_START=2047 /DNA_END=2366 /DNA_ORIENTATION=+